MRTAYELFDVMCETAKEAKQNVIKLMQSHNITSLNTKVYMMDYDMTYVDISVYDRKLDAMFYDALSMITLDENGDIHLFYDGEDSGECYEPTNTDWLNVYCLVEEIFTEVDKGDIELFTEKE